MLLVFYVFLVIWWVFKLATSVPGELDVNRSVGKLCACAQASEVLPSRAIANFRSFSAKKRSPRLDSSSHINLFQLMIGCRNLLFLGECYLLFG